MPYHVRQSVPAPLAGATTATGGRDLRDWLHAASLPALMTGEAVLHEPGGIRPSPAAGHGRILGTWAGSSG